MKKPNKVNTSEIHKSFEVLIGAMPLICLFGIKDLLRIAVEYEVLTQSVADELSMQIAVRAAAADYEE